MLSRPFLPGTAFDDLHLDPFLANSVLSWPRLCCPPSKAWQAPKAGAHFDLEHTCYDSGPLGTGQTPTVLAVAVAVIAAVAAATATVRRSVLFIDAVVVIVAFLA
eukprot:4422967-Amphidinium_carterae.1